MTKRRLKNVGASVRARLLVRSRETGEDFQTLLWRYAVERFLFRLGQSPYRGSFVLKGAMLFVLWDEPFHRPTQGIDLAAQGTAGPDDVVPALQHVCRIAAADGVVFGADQMSVTQIRGATDEGGIRIRFPATVDVARVTVQVDVGFGDSIQPPPADAEFPPLLGTATSRVLAYPSEKLSAAVAHGEHTSRYKDFFDLYFMARRFRFEGVRLIQAFAATFDGRRCPTEDILLPPDDRLLHRDGARRTLARLPDQARAPACPDGLHHRRRACTALSDTALARSLQRRSVRSRMAPRRTVAARGSAALGRRCLRWPVWATGTRV